MSVLTYYKTVFAPYDVPDPATLIVGLAANAARLVRVDIYGLTYGPLIDALIAAHGRGVTVRIVADHSQSAGTAEHPQLQRLVNAGIDLVVGVSARGGINHSKYLIIDDEVVGFGSFNFSLSALAQDNTFTETNDANMVPVFVANWQRVYDDATGPHFHAEWQLHPTSGGTA